MVSATAICIWIVLAWNSGVKLHLHSTFDDHACSFFADYEQIMHSLPFTRLFITLRLDYKFQQSSFNTKNQACAMFLEAKGVHCGSINDYTQRKSILHQQLL